MHIMPPYVFAWGLFLAVLLIAGCDHETHPADSTDTAAADHQPRLVTLAPSLSQMITDLGLADQIVGVSEHDAAAPKGLPIVGTYASVNTELLLSTRPTHVLTQAGPGGAPTNLKQLADQGLFELYTFAFPMSIQDISRVLYDEDHTGSQGLSVGQALGRPREAHALQMRLMRQLAAIRTLTADEDQPTVLMVIGTGPIMASGPGTVNDEVLGFAGGLNAADDATVTAPEYDREMLLEIAPEVVLFLMPNAPELTEDDPRLAPFAGLPIPAMESGRVYVLNDPLVLLPSTSIGRVCAEMAKAIHPQLSEEIDHIMSGQDWDRHD